MIKDLVRKNRSYRRFDEDFSIDYSVLSELVDLARLTPSSVNLQPLRYRIINKSDENKKVFETLSWAGLLKNWNGPEIGEQPSAYIIILCDTNVASNMKIDVGIAAQTIMLGAAEKGLGGCMLGSVKREILALSLGIDLDRYSIELVLALGKPNENIKIVEIPENNSTAYYRDEYDIHCVPKRSIDDIII